MRDYRDAKSMAKTIRDVPAKRHIKVTHSEALEIVAQQFGFATWNILSSKIIGSTSVGEKEVVLEQAVPIIRIFDVEKAGEFYLGFLGFSIDWEHRFGDDFPLYMQVSRSGLKLHLSEHAGDASPGGNMCVYMSGIRDFQKELAAREYRYMKPGVKN
jgi:hypothetical protein